MEAGTITTIDNLNIPNSIERGEIDVLFSDDKHLEVNDMVDSDGLITYKKRKVSTNHTSPKGCDRLLQSFLVESVDTPLLAETANGIAPMPTQHSVSAKRKFPFGCGQNAHITADELHNFISPRSNIADEVNSANFIKQGEGYSDPGGKGANSSKCTLDEKIASETLQMGQRKITSPDGKVTNTPTKSTEKNSVSPNNEEYEDGEQQLSGLDFFRDKVIVQALMAAPICPWMQAKHTPKSTRKVRLNVKKEVYASGPKGEHTPRSTSKGRINVKKEGSLSRPDSPVMSVNEEVATPDLEVLDGERSVLVKNEDVFPSCSVNKRDTDAEGKDVLVFVKPISARSSAPLGYSLNLMPFGLSSSGVEQVVTRKKVRETLRLFHAIVRKLLQEEEMNPKGQTQAGKRIDLVASKLLKEKNRWVNTGKPIMGSVPGVEVGDEFQYRVELCLIGLHRILQGGIDYMKQGNTIAAISIVSSGGYADDFDNSDLLIYSGQGGGHNGDKKKIEDQKLERGNLALKNSIDAKTPVRVIRGFKEMKILDNHESLKPKVSVTYTYDGLYQVEEYWKEKGSHGYCIFKFKLRRLPGQPELAWKIVKQVTKSNKTLLRRGVCVHDISNGQEKFPICVINTLDNDRPLPFMYIKKMMYPKWHLPTPPRGCDCTDGCSDSGKCTCAVKNGGEIPFNHNGAIVEAKPLIYECGPSCKCPPSCHNRVSQRGIKFQLEVFKTKSRGWGVRSLTSIPSGSFVCEYAGELLRDKEADERTGNDEYLFDIGQNYNDQSLWEGLSNFIPDLQTSACEAVEEVGYTIDALSYGNVGRFINHSCSPNLYAQNVLYDHDEKTLPHIMLFAAENIPPLQELTYHYNYTLNQVHDSEGNIKIKECYCGSNECTGRLY